MSTANPSARVVEAVEASFPSNWCDPLLTGPNAVIRSGGNWQCPDIEALLAAVKARVLKAITAQPGASVDDEELRRLRAEVAILENNIEAEQACRESISQAFDKLNDECAELHHQLAGASGVGEVSEAMVEAAAEAHWNVSPGGHKMLEKAGYATEWASQPRAVKRDTYKQVRAALTAALRGAKP